MGRDTKVVIQKYMIHKVFVRIQLSTSPENNPEQTFSVEIKSFTPFYIEQLKLSTIQTFRSPSR